MENTIKERLVHDNNEEYQSDYNQTSSTNSNKNNVRFESESLPENKFSETESELDLNYASLHYLESYLWTIKDKDRLESIYNLAVKQGSFHDHNINLVTLNIDLDQQSDNKQDDIVFCIMKFQSLKYKDKEISTNINPILVSFKDMNEILNINKLSSSNPSDHFIWINIFDLGCLSNLVKTYKIHSILAHRFYDLRSFSSFQSISDGSFMITICSPYMKNSTKFTMNKIFIYISKDIIITYEIELLSPPLNKENDDDDDDDYYKLNSKSRSIESRSINTETFINDDEFDEDEFGIRLSGVRFSDYSSPSKYERNLMKKKISSPIISKIISLFQKENTETTFNSEMTSFDKIRKFGLGYFLFEILTESLSLIDSIIEFLSYSVNCYQDNLARKNITGFRQLKDIYYVETSVQMVDQILLEAKLCINSILIEVGCLDIKVSQNIRETNLSSKINLNINIILANKDKEILPFIISVADAYNYKLICTQILLGRASTTQNDLLTITDLKTQQSQIILSIIATIFLPLNFFAGMYGMNFFDYDSQKYTLHILNENEGIYKFYLLIAITTSISILTLIYIGLIEIRIKWIQNLIIKIKSFIKLNEC